MGATHEHLAIFSGKLNVLLKQTPRKNCQGSQKLSD